MGLNEKAITVELKNKLLDSIRRDSVRIIIRHKEGRDFYANGITFNNICKALRENVSGGDLNSLKKIKKECKNLEADGILEYIWGEPPYYILKETIKFI